MTTIETLPRTERMRQWMAKNEITDRSLAEKLGLKRSRVTRMLNEETMPTEHSVFPLIFCQSPSIRSVARVRRNLDSPVCWNPIKGPATFLDRLDEFNPASRRNHANGKESLA